MMYAFRLHCGDDLLGSIKGFAQEHQIGAAVVLSAVGCVSLAVIRDASGINRHELAGRYEIVSLTGTVSAARTHLHISLAGEDMHVIGGHLCEGTLVNTTCEIVLTTVDGVRFAKEFDPKTGYNELKIEAI